MAEHYKLGAAELRGLPFRRLPAKVCMQKGTAMYSICNEPAYILFWADQRPCCLQDSAALGKQRGRVRVYKLADAFQLVTDLRALADTNHETSHQVHCPCRVLLLMQSTLQPLPAAVCFCPKLHASKQGLMLSPTDIGSCCPISVHTPDKQHYQPPPTLRRVAGVRRGRRLGRHQPSRQPARPRRWSRPGRSPGCQPTAPACLQSCGAWCWSSW